MSRDSPGYETLLAHHRYTLRRSRRRCAGAVLGGVVGLVLLAFTPLPPAAEAGAAVVSTAAVLGGTVGFAVQTLRYVDAGRILREGDAWAGIREHPGVEFVDEHDEEGR